MAKRKQGPFDSIENFDGCVARLPKVGKGEVRELGSTFHPDVVGHFHRVRKHWMNAQGDFKKEVELTPRAVEELKRVAKSRRANGLELVKIIEANIATYLGIESLGAPLKKLPVDPPVQGVREDFLTEEDPRSPLRGQRGLFATIDMEPGYVVGLYRGYVTTETVHNELLLATPARWSGNGNEWELRMEQYCFTDMESEYAFDTNVKGAIEKHQLYCEAVGYGNLCARANDPTILDDLVRDYVTEYPQMACVGGKDGNCSMYVALIRGWPHLFMVAHTSIRKHEELLYPYGAGYWQFHALCIGRIQRDIKCQPSWAEIRSRIEHRRELITAGTKPRNDECGD